MTERRRRICIVRQQSFYELPVRREAEAFRDAGFDVEVVLMAGEEPPGTEQVDGVTIRRLPGSRIRGGMVRYLWDYGTFFLRTTGYLTRRHLRQRFDVIQVNTMPDLLVFCTVFARLMGARVTVFMKEPVPELFETIYGRRLDRILVPQEQWAIRYAHAAFTVTNELKETYVSRGANREKIAVVLNGPDGRNLLELAGHGTVDRDGGHFTLVCNGTVEERYGHEVLLRATALARRVDPRIRLRITGTGTAIPRLKTLAHYLNLGDGVTFLGWLSLSDLVRELERADAGVIPMRASPYSHLVHTNKMYDYTIFGKPVIASRLRSVESYFDDGAVCFFEPDDPHSLAAAILRLARDPEGRAAQAAKAQELLASKWGWEHQKEILVDTTVELINR